MSQFTHVKNKIVKFDDDEQLMIQMIYGDVIALDIPVISDNVVKFNGYPLFKETRLEYGNNETRVLTTNLNYKKLNDIRGHHSILSESFGEFIDNNTYISMNGSSLSNVIAHHKFNEFWGLTPEDTAYKNPIYPHIPFVSERIVKLSKERFLELSKQYGYGVTVLDIEIPENTKAITVDEGTLFWVKRNTQYSGMEYFLSSSYCKAEFPDNHLIIRDNHYGQFEPMRNYFQHSLTRTRYKSETLIEFADFWKLPKTHIYHPEKEV